jgi:hypothetical protein
MKGVVTFARPVASLKSSKRLRPSVHAYDGPAVVGGYDLPHAVLVRLDHVDLQMLRVEDSKKFVTAPLVAKYMKYTGRGGLPLGSAPMGRSGDGPTGRSPGW